MTNWTVTEGKIQSDAVTAARIEAFDPDELGPAAKAQWEELGRRLAAHAESAKRFPLVARACSWPLIGGYFARLRLKWILERAD